MLNQHARDLIADCQRRVAHGYAARERSEAATERVAQEVINHYVLRSQTFHCADERHDYLADVASEARVEYGLTDEQHDYLIQLLNDAAPKAVEP
jgi:pyridoxal biosynthesis lyase PdxS